VSDEDNPDVTESTFVASNAAEIHATLLEAEVELRKNHEAKAALLLSDAIREMNDLTGEIREL